MCSIKRHDLAIRALARLQAPKRLVIVGEGTQEAALRALIDELGMRDRVQLAGAVGDEESIESESFSEGLLEYPQYTRPREFRGMVVPEVLLSGDHARISRWRRAEAIRRTMRRRPDLVDEIRESQPDLLRLADEGAGS